MNAFATRRAATIAAAFTLTVAACGGGGGSGPIPTQTRTPTPTPTPSPSVGTPTENVASLSVDSFNNLADLNSPYFTIQVCAPGSTTDCQTIDHVVVDTGSLGVRLLAASIDSSVLSALPRITATSAGSPPPVITGTLAECQQFGGGYTWGSVRYVDIAIPGTNKSASNIPIQIIGDMDPPPAECVSQSINQTSLAGPGGQDAAGLGANGLVGMNLFTEDCPDCVGSAKPGSVLVYTVCTGATGSACTPTTVPLSQQVANPVPFFASDNNGFSIKMQPIPAAGAPSASGSLVFGIGTQSNNALGGATVFLADPTIDLGVVETSYKGNTNDNTVFDTGSSLYYFTDDSIQRCGQTPPESESYCPGGPHAAPNSPGTTLSLEATIMDYQGNVPTGVAFEVTSFVNVSDANYALDDVGGTAVFDDFIWGMPFFYGRTVFFGIAKSQGQAPYYAF